MSAINFKQCCLVSIVILVKELLTLELTFQEFFFLNHIKILIRTTNMLNSQKHSLIKQVMN